MHNQIDNVHRVMNLRVQNTYEMIKELEDKMKYLIASNMIMSALMIIVAILVACQ